MDYVHYAFSVVVRYHFLFTVTSGYFKLLLNCVKEYAKLGIDQELTFSLSEKSIGSSLSLSGF